ncbi:MAG: hypothetical protein HY717_12355 [Planctomycetes bacterium]|nr:hypothetical protein [Planctomycetota bacterium]
MKETAPTVKAGKILRDLVEVRPHPTVVRLEHLQAGDAGWITSTYHLTRDVESHLRSLCRALAMPAGCGIFIIGQYGSGKSHFLAYVTQNLRAGKLLPGGPEVEAVSLLNFRASAALEDIVDQALGLAGGESDRRLKWSKAAERFPRGLLLVLDELSEFLRSKPDRQSFNEDIRYLQFLGEWTQGARFWILAAVQEQIEHAGELEHGLYRKIKDRYPLRFLLTPAHVKDLLSESILVKKEGYEEAVKKIAEEVIEAFPSLPIKLDDLRAIYPLHPATLELLEEVRDQFSQARGIVDFTVTRLAGSPARGVAPFLDQPWGSLLAPDAIVEHFQDLFEVQSEFLPLAQQFLPWYRQHLEELFPNSKQRELAWRLIRLLILTHLSPARKGLTAREAACWLLHRATRLDPEKNLEVIDRLLKQLAEKGRFIAQVNDLFRVHLEDDGDTVIERHLKRELAELRELREQIFEILAPLLAESDFNPFQLSRDDWQSRIFRWNFHDRAYHVYLGNGEPPLQKGLAVCLRLPWGESGAAPGAYTVRPAPLQAGDELIELAALMRLRERRWGGDLERRLEARIAERSKLFAAQVKNAYLSATVVSPGGSPETPPYRNPALKFQGWLDILVEWILRRTYPAFERFAPTHGPLPLEAYRQLLRFVSEHDLGEPEAPEPVKVIREAYLVPMGLLQRQGREYVFPRDPEKNELVKLLLPLLDSQPAPKVVYEHLANPIYGLVEDQVSLLLISLLILGEIDLVKDRKSYRTHFEILPNPIQYDKIVPGSALRLEQLVELEKLLDGLQVRAPRQWTVLAQRRCAQKLREVGKERCAPLQAAILKLESLGQGGELAAKLRQVVSWWAALDKGENELQGLQQFLYEIGTSGRFLSTLAEISDLPGKVERLLAEVDRFRHLWSHPGLARFPDAEFRQRLELLGPPPRLDQIELLEQWLKQSQQLYGAYKEAYRRRHQEWWSSCSSHPIWKWQPLNLMASRHLGLEQHLKKMDVLRERAFSRRCRGLVNLDFQPACTCEFDGQSSPLRDDLLLFDRLREELQSATIHFFQQDTVRERVRRWVDEGLEVNPATLSYLEGRELLPEVKSLDLFDRYLAGMELIKEVEAEEVIGLLGEGTWDKREALAALEAFLSRFGGSRLRFKKPAPESSSPIASWCLEQALRFGVPLPKGLSARDHRDAFQALRPEWVSAGSLERLEELGLSDPALDQIAGWLIEGRIPGIPARAASPLVSAVLEILEARDPETPEELAGLAERLYRQHQRLLRAARAPWLGRLERLAAQAPRTASDDLVAALARHPNVPWLILDCLGLPLLGMLREHLESFLPHWRLASLEFARVSPQTTTDACYRQLLEAGFNQPIEKINCLDALLHQRFVPFEDLCRLGAAELGLAMKRVLSRLDPGRPLLLFADHGFRIGPDGGSFQHGGPSALERLVPVLRLEPGR